MAGPNRFAAALTLATRELSAPRDVDETLATIVSVARDSMPEIDEAGISVIHRDGRIETRASTGDVVRRLDELQYQLGEGPCLQAMDLGSVLVPRARHEQRWPDFIAAAVRMGMRSMLGVRLHVGEQTMGALNLYSLTQDEISDETEQVAELFAAHAALALGHARQLDNLNKALASRKTIGLALGILMERLSIDEDRAFGYLTRLSATTETKLRDVAASVVEDAATQHSSSPGVRQSGGPAVPQDG